MRTQCAIRVEDAPANQTFEHNPLFRATATRDVVILRGVWLRDDWENIDAPSPSKLREIVCHELWHVRQFRSGEVRFFLTKAEAEARAIFGGSLREREGEPTVVGRAHQSLRAVAIFRSQPDTREALEKYVAHASLAGITLPAWLALEELPPPPPRSTTTTRRKSRRSARTWRACKGGSIRFAPGWI